MQTLLVFQFFFFFKGIAHFFPNEGLGIWWKQLGFSFFREGNGIIEPLVRMPIHQPGFHGSKPHRGFESVF